MSKIVRDADRFLSLCGGWQAMNPKTCGSGILSCRPQVGFCEGNCTDCFYNGGRYYEDINRAHIPHPTFVRAGNSIIRMNDGNDSNHQRDLVLGVASMYDRVFFNTSIPRLVFPGPVVLTVNGRDTDNTAWLLPKDTPGFRNLMAVRVRTNTWNLPLVKRVIDHYVHLDVPVCITYMAYYRGKIQDENSYDWHKRTLNSYWVIKDSARLRIERELGVSEYMIYPCTITGDPTHMCLHCGQCKTKYERWVERNERI